MEQYTVTGMSCAACSARVEKAVSHVSGVTSCSVSLLTNSMGVEGTADSAGSYCRSTGGRLRRIPKGRGAGIRPTSPSRRTRLPDHETPVLKTSAHRVAGISASCLMYFSMGHMMWGWPLPAFFDGQSCGHGAGSDAADHRRHGHQSEVLHQRLQEPVPRFAEYGYARRPRLDRFLWYTAPMPCSP